jgi:hypothetical protein
MDFWIAACAKGSARPVVASDASDARATRARTLRARSGRRVATERRTALPEVAAPIVGIARLKSMAREGDAAQRLVARLDGLLLTDKVREVRTIFWGDFLGGAAEPPVRAAAPRRTSEME